MYILYIYIYLTNDPFEETLQRLFRIWESLCGSEFHLAHAERSFEIHAEALSPLPSPAS